MSIEKPNRLGWVTSLSVSSSYDGALTFDLSGYVVPERGAFQTLQSWLQNGISAPRLQREWCCLYCTSPNSIDKTHCCNCGAPRNFILG